MAEAIRTAIIFVTARYICCPSTPEGGFLRDDADAARQNGAIAACFTNLLCDEDAFGRIRKSTALAPPPFLSRACLFVDQHGAARCLTSRPLTSIQFVPVTDRDPWREGLVASMMTRIVAQQNDQAADYATHWPGTFVHSQPGRDPVGEEV